MGETKSLKLDKWLHNDFEAGQEDEYTVRGTDVGELLMIKLIKGGGGLFSDWFVNRVTIKKVVHDAVQRIYNFPCFRWVSSEAVVFEGKGRNSGKEMS